MHAEAIVPAVRPDPLADLEQFVADHQRNLWRFLRALGADAGLADELAQDAFLMAWRKGLVVGDTGAAMAWLLRTARFLWLQRVRLRRRAEVRRSDAVLHYWQQHLAPDGGEAWLEALAVCRAGLSPRVAAALQLFYGDGLSRDAVAAAVGMRPNGMKTLLQRARAWLRTCIERRLA